MTLLDLSRMLCEFKLLVKLSRAYSWPCQKYHHLREKLEISKMKSFVSVLGVALAGKEVPGQNGWHVGCRVPARNPAFAFMDEGTEFTSVRPLSSLRTVHFDVPLFEPPRSVHFWILGPSSFTDRQL